MVERHRLLLVEDVATDAELVVSGLKRAGLLCEHRRIDTAPEFEAALESFRPHVILSDFSMPHFDGMEALALAQRLAPQIPFIFVSGTLGEEYAIRALKNGATDYVLKTNLARLPSAVERALEEAGARRKRQQLESQLRDSEAKYRGLIEQASDGIFVVDAAGIFTLVNSRACELLGYSEAELIGANHSITYLENERGTLATRLELAEAGATLRYERTVLRKDGSTFPAEFSSRMVDTGRFQVIFHDITERKLQERKIARLSRIHAVLSGINSTIVRVRTRQQLFEQACRIVVDRGGFIIGWLARVDDSGQMLVPLAQAGLPMKLDGPGAASGNSPAIPAAGLAEIVLKERRYACINDLNEASMGEVTNLDTMRIRGEAVALGARSVIALPLYVDERIFGILTLYAAEPDFFDDEEIRLLDELASDISFALSYLAKDEQVQYLAYYDAVTGLANRTLFIDRLGLHLQTAQREQCLSAVVLTDIERFHVINDTLGRLTGDLLLKEVANRLRELVRPEDTIARVAADCFAIALTSAHSTAQIVHLLQERIAAVLTRPVSLAGRELRVAARLGVAVYPSDADSSEMLYANAEAALKKAKQSGERILFYAPEMNARVAESLTLENKLRNALENNQFVLHYQPKVLAEGRELVGLEALIRWQDPERGIVPPAKFIPLMEETGLILAAGRWALSQVARDCETWKSRGLRVPTVAVNVSPLQVRQKEFLKLVTDASEKVREAGSMLEIEITESSIMENLEAVIRTLQIIRGLGVEIALDDFGTGYSSLAYLARLPIHTLKIDRSFVSGMAENRDSLAIVTTIISMARALRLQIVAEGVETIEQAVQLETLGCHQLQGYLVSRPLPPEQLFDFLSSARYPER